MSSRVTWPDGRPFAFSIFDDPDGQTIEVGREVYSFLADLGLRTTKGVWPLASDLPRGWGGSCDDADYREWCQDLQSQGFEIGYHNARQTTSARADTEHALERFAELFGHSPRTMSNHYNCDEDIYWGEHRVSNIHRVLYNVVTRLQNHDRFFGHVPGHPLFWGDLCQERIRYVRNFVYADIDTLASCPCMPYHDPRRPFVAAWYASSDGADVRRFTRMLAEANQDRLAEAGGACIMYTHFGHGFVNGGRLDSRFREVITRLSKLGGWFVPVAELLDHLRPASGAHVLTNAERARLERRWLWQKIRHGTS